MRRTALSRPVCLAWAPPSVSRLKRNPCARFRFRLEVARRLRPRWRDECCVRLYESCELVVLLKGETWVVNRKPKVGLNGTHTTCNREAVVVGGATGFCIEFSDLTSFFVFLFKRDNRIFLGSPSWAQGKGEMETTPPRS